MAPNRSTRFRRPTDSEHQVLRELIVRPIRPEERARFDHLLVAHHYLQSTHLVSEHLRYVATHHGRWLALLAWAAPARHLLWHLARASGLVAFAATLSQTQLRARRFRAAPHIRRYAAPAETTFTRVLAAVDNDALPTTLLAFSPTPQTLARTWERNRRRQETRQTRTIPVPPEQICFPVTSQAVELRRRVVEKGQKKKERPLRLLLTSATPER